MTLTQDSDEKLGVSPRPLDVLILAAGLGTRMRSNIAKVLHRLDGRPLIEHVCAAAAAISPRSINVIVGHQARDVEAAVNRAFPSSNLRFVTQESQKGTGDAVMAARDVLAESQSTIMVLSGDVPLITPQTLRALLEFHRAAVNGDSACTLLSVCLDDPAKYGRITRDKSGEFERIVEYKDASAAELAIKEINAGIYCFESEHLFPALAELSPVNAQGEYYLTDVPDILKRANNVVKIFEHSGAREVAGINTREELSEFESMMRATTNRRLMLDAGVTFVDPANVYVSSQAKIGRDCVLYPNVHIEGETVIGDNCSVRQGTRITNSKIGDNSVIKDNCVIEDSEVSNGCSIGPFAHLRMGAHVESNAAVGNFVEMKKSRLGRKSKAMHLSYLGDATIGEGTNIGAGTITCNYDGKNKNPTVIEDNVKIGSDTMLVAPVRVGSRSVTAAGSVVTEDVPPDTMVAGVPAKIKKHLKTVD